jgi:putative nucleotidyltransferase with HDIG domain
MSTGSKKKRRIERASSLELPPGFWGNLWAHLRSGHVLVRISLCALTAMVLLVVTRGWAPPLAYRQGDVPPRDVVVRTPFEKIDEDATRKARDLARQNAYAVYDQDPSLIEQRRGQLENEVNQLVQATNYDDVIGLWARFQPLLAAGTPPPSEDEIKQQYQKFKDALSGQGALDAYRKALVEALQPAIQKGVLDKLPEEHDASSDKIAVRVVGKPGVETIVNVSDVLREFARQPIMDALTKPAPPAKPLPPEVAGPTFNWWLRDRLPVTLKLNLEATRAEQEKKVAEVKPVTTVYRAGDVLARAYTTNAEPARLPIGDEEINLIRLEYAQELAQRPFLANLGRSLAVLGMYVALYILCGFFIHHREPRIIGDLRRLATLLSIVVVTVSLMIITSHDDWRAELIPLMLFGMTLAIAYQQEIALLLTAAVTLVGVVALGQGLAGAVVLMASAASAILLLGRIRSRSKILTVGFAAGGVAMLTTIGVGTLEGVPFLSLATLALFWGLWAVIAGSLMTCLLPLVEKVFSVQTDLSLIELGDPAHPLLQELIRRAPGTYNHSITVASLAEAAAEAIGARGLLVRVGAYFHDIGKMLKPGYFIENQAQGDNRHRTLVPAMSTLVIIAHVKDGADLARQNKIPEPIVDFIQQHHGTTLVEYFYRQASDSKKSDPNGSEVDESSFRYPGPKPQTKEAGILMIADAVESASRVLVEPTPSRIESLVEDISRKRLLDGQFDECGLTLEEVRRVGDSLVKSLTAVYHGRVKYPEQETA